MLRILGRISIDGTRSAVDRLASTEPIPGGKIWQTGLKRKIPDVDSWCYESPLYRFHGIETLDNEVQEFVLAHARLGELLTKSSEGVKYAFFTLYPVAQSAEESFACTLSCDTLQAISRLCVGLQIAPGSVMPDAPYWSEQQE